MRSWYRPCARLGTYTGNKGCHVYGFTGYAPASEIRQAAKLVMESLGTWQQTGESLWTDANADPVYGFQNVNVEVYPKQDQIEAGKYGNLCRLPLGVNLKRPQDPTFFIDQRTDHLQLVPHPDPAALLVSGDPWR